MQNNGAIGRGKWLPRRGLIIALLTFAPIAFIWWFTWEYLEGNQKTLYGSQFKEWALVSGVSAALWFAFSMIWWRSLPDRIAVMLGALSWLPFAAICFWVEIQTSGGFV